ncbi:MAG: dihydroorotate dehydrogenase electron transfer subunit [Chloroherpetonaceae bacterium]|nr:dihydroorotate dehydrogenase electron transfer subunit [Chloroherpetonaceae bacterium]MDW8437044.1 dihydroorotate dehydrogenase electron transfer subunit [Chloroherpetonaceae bacterium]
MIAKTEIFDLPLEVISNERLSRSVNVIALRAPELAPRFKAGQFLEIKTSDSLFPLLRRPFSAHRVSDGTIEIMNKVVGVGTRALYDVEAGEKLQTLAPLGNAFGYDKTDFDLAILISGGIGVAPMAMLEDALRARGKEVLNIVGARTAEELVARHLSNVRLATDDGTAGFKGNVVELFEKLLPSLESKRLRAFACGPNPMLNALSKFCNARAIPCEVSIESTMGCGVGICYGCPIRVRDSSGKMRYELLCQYGSVVDAREIVFDE